MLLVFCPTAAVIAEFKRALALTEDASSPVAVPGSARLMEHVTLKGLYLYSPANEGDARAAMEQVPSPKQIAYLLPGMLRFTRVRNCPPNGFEIRQAEELGDLMPGLDESDLARLNERVFDASTQSAAEHMFRMVVRVAAAAHTPQKRALPKEWSERLQADGPTEAATDEGDACIICCEGVKRTVLFIPCDHCCACEACARRMMEEKAECPICREPVEDVRRIKRA